MGNLVRPIIRPVVRPVVSYGAVAPFGGKVKLKPTNPYIAWAGDSRTEDAFDMSTGRFYLEGVGGPAWAWPLSGHRFKLLPTEYGTGGDTSTMILARWGAVLASGAGTIGLLATTNDRGGANMTAAQSIANVTAMIEQAGDAGICIALANETQRFGANALVGQQLANHIEVHDFLDWAARYYRHVWGVDTWSLITEDDTRDGLHLNLSGGRKLGSANASTIRHMLPDIDYSRPYRAGEVTSTPALNANPQMAGVTGSKGSGVINADTNGGLATNYSATLSGSAAGITAKCSKEIIDDIEYQVFEFSGAGGAGTNALTLRPTADLTLTNGETYDVRADVIVEPGSTNILSAQVEARIDIGGTLTASRALDGYASPVLVPADGYHLPLCTPPATVPAGTITSVRGQFIVNFVPSSTVSGVVKVAALASRRVT